MDHSELGSTDGYVKRQYNDFLIGVVDDDESVREGVSSLLRSAGYRCALFPSAEAFLDSADLPNTSCAVLDIRMPGLSGLELQVRLRQMNRMIPIIVVTAHTDDAVRARALEQGAVAFLPKPFSEEALLGAIQASLNSDGNGTAPQSLS